VDEKSMRLILSHGNEISIPQAYLLNRPVDSGMTAEAWAYIMERRPEVFQDDS